VFARLEPEQREALQLGFGGYQALRRSGKAECLFNDCLANAGRDGPIERSWFVEELLREGLKLAGQTVFENSNGEIGPGSVRLWDNVTVKGPNGSAATVYQGPWPWLTAISPNTTSDEEYGNARSYRPAPTGPHLWENYQYAQVCEYLPDPSGKINAACKRKTPPPPPPPAPGETPLFGLPEAYQCEGGTDYNIGGECLKIPEVIPGTSIRLRGFNWITGAVTARVTSKSDPGLSFHVEAPVWGDRLTPIKDADGHSIVDHRVHDSTAIGIPAQDPRDSTKKLPPGLYAVHVEVQNTTGAVFDGSVPPILVTNELLFRVMPAPDR